MSINLRKGQKIDLTKRENGQTLRHVIVGLGWDAVKQAKSGGGFFSNLFGGGSAPNADCDASVILCGENGKVISRNINDTLIYFGNLRHKSGAIIHKGDNLTGDGDGDDEQIAIDLQMIPQDIHKLVFVVNIYDADKRGQHFGMIQNAFIRLVDTDKMQEVCRFNLTESYDGMTGLVVGEIYRRNGDWKFNAVGQGVKQASRLDALLSLYQ
ncbi:MAG: TerD family protein [Selenomonadaceae bacterium]|nr:TerD family protein [Selenomonadaceae bacterium]MEE1361035.1 TerD family protein [Selenomonadaceae bacterium]